MKNEVFVGEGMKYIKENYPELYKIIVDLNNEVYTGEALDYKTQKLIAVAITAAAGDERATKKQMSSGMSELGITKDEIFDALKVVLLTSGMPPFVKAVKILNEL
ncbi:MAG TPA: carboxymuconolactone decarboxylase family protein [Methanothermococcus okinawensis]|uniref:Carboxymuconolactone decarboxylase family protein n=1 Tax=Methanothermococcus okinawensis TaxID=155863 RepID=A0A832YRI2_9EURY|nr:carboxymuconolactone decarboxylase family protein [Methanothermococcus okinawensis]